MPVIEVKMPEPLENFCEMGKAAKEPAHKNILVIDDEVSVNNNIRKILTKKGYHVDQAVTKSETLEKIHSASYHQVLLDLRIPRVQRLELLKRHLFS